MRPQIRTAERFSVVATSKRKEPASVNRYTGSFKRLPPVFIDLSRTIIALYGRDVSITHHSHEELALNLHFASQRRK